MNHRLLLLRQLGLGTAGRREISTASQPLMEIPELRNLQPFYSTRSLGFVTDDILPSALLDLRAEVATCIPNRDVTKFLGLAAQAARELEALPRSHRLFFNRHFMFLRPPSPAAPVFDEIMAKVFNKACDRDPACEISMENTSSGYGLSGARGVGKSHLLRLCTTLAPVMLPRVVSAYVDAQSHFAAADPKDVTSPFALLRDAFIGSGNSVVVEHDSFVATDVNTLVCNAIRHDLVTMLSIDELRAMYTNKSLWQQLQQMASSSGTMLLVSDSTSRLPAIVKSDSDSRSTELTKRWYGTTNQSLNDTKLSILPLQPLTRSEQYDAFLKPRVPKDLLEKCGLHSDGMHILTGGCIRAIMNLLTSVREYRNYVPPPYSASKGTWHYFVLDKLRALQDDQGGFDAFNLVTVNFDTLVRWRREFQSDCASASVEPGPSPSSLASPVEFAYMWSMVEDLIGERVLRAAPPAKTRDFIGGASYTFASALQYIHLTDMAPKVFISHAMEDIQAVEALRANLETVESKVTICENPGAIASMARGSVLEWMQRQMQFISDEVSQSPRHFCVIVLTESYLRKLEDLESNNGCKDEVTAACLQLDSIAGDQVLCKRLIIGRLVPYAKLEEQARRSSILRSLLSANKFVLDLVDARHLSALACLIIGDSTVAPKP